MLQELTIVGTTVSLYKVFDALAGLTLLAYILLQTKPYSLILPDVTATGKRKSLIAFFELFLIGILLFALLLFLNRSFADWFTSGNANYYGNLTAWLIIMVVLPVLFKVSPLKAMDLLSPGLPLSLFVAKLACFFHGCCSGFEMPGSWYFNQYTGRYEFPVQMVEALVALALFFFLRWYSKRKKHIGSVFPVYLITYSTSRFLTESLRADLPNVIGPLDAYQIMSFAFAIVGLFLFFNAVIAGNSIQAYYDKMLSK